MLSHRIDRPVCAAPPGARALRLRGSRGGGRKDCLLNGIRCTGLHRLGRSGVRRSVDRLRPEEMRQAFFPGRDHALPATSPRGRGAKEERVDAGRPLRRGQEMARFMVFVPGWARSRTCLPARELARAVGALPGPLFPSVGAVPALPLAACEPAVKAVPGSRAIRNSCAAAGGWSTPGKMIS